MGGTEIRDSISGVGPEQLRRAPRSEGPHRRHFKIPNNFIPELVLREAQWGNGARAWAEETPTR